MDLLAVFFTGLFYSRTFSAFRARPSTSTTSSKQTGRASDRKDLLSKAFALISASYVILILPTMICNSISYYFSHRLTNVRHLYPDYYGKNPRIYSVPQLREHKSLPPPPPPPPILVGLNLLSRQKWIKRGLQPLNAKAHSLLQASFYPLLHQKFYISLPCYPLR